MNKLMALSFWDPWGSAIILGLKKVETRSRYFSYRGDLVIHIAKNESALELITISPMRPYFQSAGIDVENFDFPLGCAIGIVEVIGCEKTELLRGRISDQERAFGDYTNNRYGLLLANVRPFVKPVPYHGHQGLFPYDGPVALKPDAMAAYKAALDHLDEQAYKQMSMGDFDASKE